MILSVILITISVKCLQMSSVLIAIGKFSTYQIAELKKLSDKLVFVDSDTLTAGHPCVTTDFDNSVVKVLDYF